MLDVFVLVKLSSSFNKVVSCVCGSSCGRCACGRIS